MLIRRYLIPGKKADLNPKITKIENEIPIITGLLTTTALNTKNSEIEKKKLMLLIWLPRLV